MKTQGMDNEQMKEVLEEARHKRLENPLYKEYLVGLTNTILGSISSMVFINALQSVDNTKVTKQDIRDMLPREYLMSLTDDAVSIMLDSIAEYYMKLGYQVTYIHNMENRTVELHITII